jgi:hypothetical protein
MAKTPYEYGKEAFESGIKAAPVLDAAFMKAVGDDGGEFKALGYGIYTALQAWVNGWHEANLKREVK